MLRISKKHYKQIKNKHELSFLYSTVTLYAHTHSCVSSVCSVSASTFTKLAKKYTTYFFHWGSWKEHDLSPWECQSGSSRRETDLDWNKYDLKRKITSFEWW